MYDDDSVCLYHIRSQLAQRQQFARSRSENNWAFLPPSPSATVSNRRSRSTIEERGGEMKKKKIRSIPSPLSLFLSLSLSSSLVRTVQRVTHAEDSVFESWQSGQRVSLRASTISGYFADFPRNLHCMQAPYVVEEKKQHNCTPPGFEGEKTKLFPRQLAATCRDLKVTAQSNVSRTVSAVLTHAWPPPYKPYKASGKESRHLLTHYYYRRGERGKGDTQRY